MSYSRFSRFSHHPRPEIAYLQELNDALKDRFDVQSNLRVLSNKLHTIETDERQNCERHNGERKQHLAELERCGADLCQEHSRVLHQIEHIDWHLGHGHKHQHCSAAGGGPVVPPSAMAASSCKSGGSAVSLVPRGGGLGQPSGHMHQQHHHHKSHETLSLENTSERLIKSIAELRRRIFAAKEKLEKEIQRKKCVEKNLSELRRDISRQKKIISTRRATPLPAIPPQSVRKSAFVQ